MKCPRCQHENEAGAKFCEECATPIVRTCRNCGHHLSPTAKFCPECAHPTGLVTTSEISSRFSSPESYTPQYLAERILTSKAALEGERKQVTVLFADLKGSMELVADRDPEQARAILDPVLERMMEAVHRYEGTVNQVMGDGIMALFGAPVAHEDHAVRACYAALRIQERIKHYADVVHRAEGVPIQVRVGVNSGEVVVRSIGSDLHMDYTAVGQTTHLAARLEQMAMPGSVLISTETLRLSEGYVVVKPLGPRPIKGLDVPIDVYELAAAATVRSRFHAVAARGLTRFVGRDAEVTQLGHALEQTHAGHGQIVAVIGEPGVGKSRLYWEFTRFHRAHGWRVIESGSVSYGKATNYLPVVELLRTYFGIESGDEPPKIREKVIGTLVSLDRHLEPALSALLWLLDYPVDDPTWQRLDPPQRRQHVLDGVKRLLLRESQVQPLIVVFEDLHWIDAETQALIDGLVDSLPTARLLLLVNYRPEYQHTWSGKTSYRQIRIDPLPPPTADELLDALLGDDADLDPLKQFLIQRTGGNPLFLEESVRTLVETKLLTGERGAYRAAKTPATLERARQIPASTQALLAARIDRLSPERKRLLQAAAVVGTDVPFVLLHAIAAERETALRQGLAELQAAEFLYETRLFPELEYTFKHALTHEIAYGSLLQERRRTLHARVVDAIEAAYPERLSEHVERLADHAAKGEQWSKAVLYLRQAGTKALVRSANREAVTYFERALEALAHVPESRTTGEQAVDLRFDLRNSLVPLGEVDRALAHVRDAARLARALDDQHRLASVSVFMSHLLWITGEHAEAHRSAQDALTSAEALDDFPLRVNATFYLGITSVALGDYPRARTFLETVTRLLGDNLERERFGLAGFPAAMARCFLSWTLGELGEFQQGIAVGREGIRIGEAIDHAYSLIMTCWGLGHLYGVKGDPAQGLPVLERGLRLSRERNVNILLPFCLRPLGYVTMLSGRIDEGRRLLQEALVALMRTPVRLFLPLCIAHLGEASLLAGDPADALVSAEQALTIARERGERGHEAYALRLLGELAAHADPPRAEAAEAYYCQAMKLAEEHGMRPLYAHCQLGLARAYRQAGKRQQAQERLTTATTMYQKMDMQLWLEHAQAEWRALA
jgi:class 3 adenylate cyclase/tetratricopeptide (TPR) repeat protein